MSVAVMCVVVILLCGCSGTASPQAVVASPTTLGTSSGTTFVDGSTIAGPSPVEDSFVVGDVAVDADSFVVDFVSDSIAGTPEPSVTEPSPEVAVAPVPQPSTDFSLPPAPTIPKQFEPASIKLVSRETVEGVSFGVPAGWVVFRTAEEVAAIPNLSDALRTIFSQGLDGDPNRRYLMPKADIGSATPTWALISVGAVTPLTASEVSTRIEQFAVQVEGLRVAARAGRAWLNKRDPALLLRGAEGRRRLVITARLADQRTVSVATEGRGDNLASVHALLLLSVVPGPAPTV